MENRVRSRRLEKHWSQAELAERSQLSRAAISAIEIGRLVPSVQAALALARVFDCLVEDLFPPDVPRDPEIHWAGTKPSTPTRLWRAEINGRTIHYPSETTTAGLLPHHGQFDGRRVHWHDTRNPSETLVLATCDPAVGILVAEYARQTPFRLIVLQRSSRRALDLLHQGLVHVAGIHLAGVKQESGHEEAVRSALSEPSYLLRGADWQEGIAIDPSLKVSTVRSALTAKLSWVGREVGSGWAEAGVCLQLSAQEAGLQFLSVREETYDLCFPQKWEQDARIVALQSTLRSLEYRRFLSDLPGYSAKRTGGISLIK